MTTRLSAIVCCLGLVCVPLLTAAQSSDTDVAGPPAGASPDPGAVAPEPDPGAIAPSPRPGAVAPEPDPGAIAPSPRPGAVAPEPDPGIIAPAPDPGAASFRAREIIDRALEQAEEQRAAAFELGFEYFTDGWVESLAGDGRVTDTKATRNRHYPLEGHFYSELIGRDGEPLAADDARDERKKKADFVREARRHAARGERYAPDEMRVDFDHELMDRYVATLVGTEVVAGTVCWVIAFEPREGRLPDNRRLDQAMNRSTGRLWIGRHDYGVRRAEFAMQRPVRWLWGIAGTLRRATGQIEFRQIESKLWIPDRTLVEIELGVFFGMKTIRRRIRNEWVEPVAAASAEPITETAEIAAP